MKIFFILGRKPSLSIAEIYNISNRSNLHIIDSNEIFVIAEINSETNITEIFYRLGGSVKVGLIIEDPYKYIEENFISKNAIKSGKLRFAVSFYSSNKLEIDSQKKQKKDQVKLGISIKNFLKDNNVNSQFITNNKDLITSSVLIEKKKILKRGFELNLIKAGNSRYWGMTLAVQDFEGFSFRDYDRPAVNKQKGMLPPKLARIMVNLANISDNSSYKQTIWDPFCGSGTILMEALLLGNSAIGSDIDQISIDETQKNVDWMIRKSLIKEQNVKVFKHDIRQPFNENFNFDAIVTEPYLGPVLKSPISIDEYEKIVTELMPIYDSLSNLFIKNSGMIVGKNRLVVVIPIFKTFDGWKDPSDLFMKLLKKIEITHKISKYPLQWDRPGSIIRRNIKIFEK
ncbi:hypothetical protein JW887_00720 [Candidatus Dojkabacteria bacterium]|nr:hypothetical protein [Candidatus Dojkabacteria bacterium]